MRQRFYKIIVVCFLTAFLSPVYAQISINDFSANRLQAAIVSNKGINYQPLARKIFFACDTARHFRIFDLNQVPIIRGDHYIRNFGFFCRKEFEFEKQTKLPLRFRLGSLEYCNYLESKR